MGGGSSVQLVLVGLENTGKTTLLYHLKFGQYMHTQPTVGFNCEKVELNSGNTKGVTFSIWDVGGKDKMRPLWKSYLRSADGVIYVVDSADAERFEEARIELLRLVKGQNNPSCLPTLILANKQDLPDSLAPEEVAKVMSVQELSSTQQCEVLPVCAVTGEDFRMPWTACST
ncbi:hypothetical protein C0Q70_01878 [Pomacea canaliculata]|uniref:ADP-ribosylation factor-like protein 4C n=1 Tax=Pomacea canaliculata TaxID=400727 RepID=A0A2T7Q0S8_POMCA|nr:ADP-ribosylation factor-like protein 4C [Pomacea canaliculata]XP_025100608.1 ADP-ribosylation factor-like protein 4C [Pomacea canaliculata]PVD39250.1 hypothetical protein C0Q70_01878 [Pomacea canaliculata]